jgi:hypothetical protein
MDCEILLVLLHAAIPKRFRGKHGAARWHPHFLSQHVSAVSGGECLTTTLHKNSTHCASKSDMIILLLLCDVVSQLGYKKRRWCSKGYMYLGTLWKMASRQRKKDWPKGAPMSRSCVDSWIVSDACSCGHACTYLPTPKPPLTR